MKIQKKKANYVVLPDTRKDVGPGRRSHAWRVFLAEIIVSRRSSALQGWWRCQWTAHFSWCHGAEAHLHGLVKVVHRSVDFRSDCQKILLLLAKLTLRLLKLFILSIEAWPVSVNHACYVLGAQSSQPPTAGF